MAMRRAPNVEILTGAYVDRLHLSPSGREVTHVEVVRDGTRETYAGDVVVVACGAINSAALLLRSISTTHPNGLGNGSGNVGRNYMRHNNTSIAAISKDPHQTVFQKTIGLNDFYFGAKDFAFPMGNVQLLGRTAPELMKVEAGHWPAGFDASEVARRAIEFCVISEDLPRPENRVTLSSGGEITIHYEHNNLTGHDRLCRIVEAMFPHLGCEDRALPTGLYTGRRSSVAGANHQCGTVRFGDDPKTSPLDPFCKLHELDNVYVVDGSFFPSSAALNPALTIMANALRVAEHVRARLS